LGLIDRRENPPAPWLQEFKEDFIEAVEHMNALVSRMTHRHSGMVC